MNELWRLDVEEAASALEAREISSVELVRSALARVDETEPAVHAWAHISKVGALTAAYASDERRRRGEPLSRVDGIPIGVKDVIDVEGMPTRAGSASLSGSGPVRNDAASVARYRAAGGVLLGKTHTYEFAFGQGEPPTRNPRDPARYAGGSSIGSGVAVAVGAVPATLGTDTGGSIRNPASVNGLVGIKPSRGLVSTEGSIEISGTMDAIGPLASSAAGCAIVLDAIAERHPRGRSFVAIAAQTAEDANLRVGVDRRMWERWRVTPAVSERITEAAEALAAAGVDVVETSLPATDLALMAGLLISLSESVRSHRERLRRDAAGYLSDTRVMIATGALLAPRDIELAHRVRIALRAKIEAVMRAEGLSAILSPTLPAPAPRLDAMASELTSSGDDESLGSALRMLSAANLTGLPALSTPAGMLDGRPVGMHLLGRMDGDGELLGLARRHESVSPWRAELPVEPVAV